MQLAADAGLAVNGAALTESDWKEAAAIGPFPERRAFLARRKWLRELLAARAGVAAGMPIIRDHNGKPRLAGRGVEFSLSHREGWCAVALSTDCPVGVDVELIRPMEGMVDVVADFFPPVAQRAFAAATPGQQATTFFRWWTRIEAAVKASGKGLDDAKSCLAGVKFESRDLVPGLTLAVAALTNGPVIFTWSLSGESRGAYEKFDCRLPFEQTPSSVQTSHRPSAEP